MARAANMVTAGDYEHTMIVLPNDVAYIGNIPLDKTTVESYDVIDESTRKSATSAVGRAAVGAFLLGPIGLAAGLSAKNKGIHTIAIYFKDGRKSLLEVDDEIYKAIVKKMF